MPDKTAPRRAFRRKRIRRNRDDFEIPSLTTVIGHRSGFITVVGPANAGKSSLVNALVGAKVSIVSPKPQTTRLRILGVRDSEASQMVFADTPGFVKRLSTPFDRALEGAVRDAVTGVDLLLVVLDGARVLHDQGSLTAALAQCEAQMADAPQALALNKIDLLSNSEVLRALELAFAAFALRSPAIELFPVSAATGSGCAELLRWLEAGLPEGPKYFPAGTTSDQSELQLIAEIVRENVIRYLRDEVPYSSAVIVESKEDREGITVIRAAVIVERDSQKGIVIGRSGVRIKQIGSAARRELERLLGTKVHLELFVRVEKDWTRSARGFEKFVENA